MRAWLSTALVSWLLAAPAAAEEPRVRAGQKVSELLASKEPASSPSSTSAGRDDLGGRVAVWAVAALMIAAGVVFWRRRSRSSPVGSLRGEEIEVLGRAQLSHRHAVFVLRIAGRKWAVGISGDRMTSLEPVDAPLPAPRAEEAGIAAAPSGLEEKPSAARGFTVRPGDREAVSAARRAPDFELMPYRKQMDRLRGLLRGLRDESDEGEGPAEGSRP